MLKSGYRQKLVFIVHVRKAPVPKDRTKSNNLLDLLFQEALEVFLLRQFKLVF